MATKKGKQPSKQSKSGKTAKSSKTGKQAKASKPNKQSKSVKQTKQTQQRQRANQKNQSNQNGRNDLTMLRLIASLLLLLAVPLLLILMQSQQPEEPEVNPYGPEDFVSENGFMTCLTTESVPGIDVSYYQGEIDWEQVRQSGVEFAFVRIGFRRGATGTLGEDEMAQRNLRKAREAGLKVGAYFFSQAISVEEAREEARLALDILKGYRLDLPLAYDWEIPEEKARTKDMDADTLVKCVKAFCKTVEEEGYESMVYFNRDLSQTLLDIQKLGDIPVWFAMYGDYPDAPCKPDYWQYSDQGTVPGISTNVDLNLYLP